MIYPTSQYGAKFRKTEEHKQRLASVNSSYLHLVHFAVSTTASLLCWLRSVFVYLEELSRGEAATM